MILNQKLKLTIEALEQIEWLVLGLVGDKPVVALAVRSVPWNQSKTSQGTDVEPSQDVEGRGVRVPLAADEEDSRIVCQRELVMDDAAGHVILGEDINKVATLYRRSAVSGQQEPKNGRVWNIILLLRTRNKVACTSELLVDKVRREDVVMPNINVPKENTRLRSVDMRATAEETSADEVPVVHTVGVKIRMAYGEHTRNG
jgi:hypothetical protein